MQCAGEMIDSWSTDEIKNWNLKSNDVTYTEISIKYVEI